MKKNWFFVLTAVIVLLASFALADDGLGVLTQPAAQPSSEQALAEAAVLAEFPNAVIQYSLLGYDDGRAEWSIFFTDDGFIGKCEVRADTYELRKHRSYEMEADTLTADKIVEQLLAVKGPLTLLDLELDRDDGRLQYEGDAELDGKRYEFEMNASGRIVEWERD